MALSLDGSVAVYGVSGTTGTLTCANAGNAICVAITVNSATVSSISGGGVTFSRRATTSGSVIEFWTGYASGTFSAAVAVTCSGTPSFITVHAWGVSGAPSSSYFDVNGSLPDVSSSAGPATVSTTASDTMILGMFRHSSSSNNLAAAGFTEIFGSTGSGYQFTEYKIVSAAQTSLSVGDNNNSDMSGRIADAIVMAGGAAALPTHPHVLGQAVNRASRY